MSYITRTIMGGPTVWLDPEECTDEWERVQEMRNKEHSLTIGGQHREPGDHLFINGNSGQFRSKYN